MNILIRKLGKIESISFIPFLELEIVTMASA